MELKLNVWETRIEIDNTDWYAVERDGRWEIHEGDALRDYADNSAIALARMEDIFVGLGGVLPE
jgi:hypothetical protein